METHCSLFIFQKTLRFRMKMAHYPQTCGTYFHTDQKPLCFLGCAAPLRAASTDTVLFFVTCNSYYYLLTYLDFKLTIWKNIANFLCKITGITHLDF